MMYGYPNLSRLLSRKGDLLVRGSANYDSVLGVGSDGYVLTADATQPYGLKWAAVGGSFQPLDAFLTSIAALGTAADKMIYTTGVDAAAEAAITAAGRALIDDADAAAQRATLGLGSAAVAAAGDFLSSTASDNYGPFGTLEVDAGATLSVVGTFSASGVVNMSAAGTLGLPATGIVGAGSGSGLDADKLRATTPTAAGLAILDDADAAAQRTTLGLVIGTDVAAQTHATQHQSGGSDSIKLDDLATPDDNTDLNVSTTRHGLFPKLPGGSTNFWREDGSWQPAGGGSGLTQPQVMARLSVGF